MKKNYAFILILLIFRFSPVSGQCIDSTLISPGTLCPAIYEPVCGCNGVTYSNSCEAINLGGVTSFTGGICSEAPACLDLSGIDFGPCDMFLGFGWNGTGCVAVSGCTTTVAGVDYTNNLFPEIESCNSSCSDTGCINQWQLDQGPLVLCTGDFSPVCGCNGQEYTNSCFAYFFGGVTSYSIGNCLSVNCQVIPAQVNFGDCEMVLGYARKDGQMCEVVSGCGYTGDNGEDYSEYFFSTESECNNSCNNDTTITVCPDPTLINPEILCNDLFNPVCGCDNVTYSNECVAMYQYGVGIYTPGPCVTTGMNKNAGDDFSIFPNPASVELIIKNLPSENGVLAIFDISGRCIMERAITGDKTNLVSIAGFRNGPYLLRFSADDGTIYHGRFIKID